MATTHRGPQSNVGNSEARRIDRCWNLVLLFLDFNGRRSELAEGAERGCGMELLLNFRRSGAWNLAHRGDVDLNIPSVATSAHSHWRRHQDMIWKSDMATKGGLLGVLRNPNDKFV